MIKEKGKSKKNIIKEDRRSEIKDRKEKKERKRKQNMEGRKEKER